MENLIIWRGGREVEGARLESVYRGNSIMGSNPILSAIKFGQKLDVFKQIKIIEKMIKNDQKSIDLFRLFNIREFLHFIKKFKNVINNFS